MNNFVKVPIQIHVPQFKLFGTFKILTLTKFHEPLTLNSKKK
jgi:hypothetical protein